MKLKSDFMPQLNAGKKLLLVLFLLMEFVLIGAALWPTCWLILTYGPRSSTATHWVLLILGAILVFNYAYLIALLAIRIVIPRPKEGFFPRRPDGRPPREAVVYMLNALLVKARMHPPWAALISSVLVNLFPLHYFYRRFFGPNTPSISLGDTYRCIDPCLIEAGENVQFGGFCLISAHIFDVEGLLIRKVKIGDNALIGAETILSPGVEVGHHAMVAARSLVLPNTIIKPYEYWGGSPARKLKDLTPKPA